MTTAQARPKIDIWHVAHPVADLDRSVGFYCDGLGFDLVGRDEDPTIRQAFVALGNGGFCIELFIALGEDAGKPRQAADHLAFEADDLDAYRESVVAAGLSVPQIEVFDGGMKHFRLEDPDGLRLDFFQGRDSFETYLAGKQP
jgi:catechol 2,3-dioxygenase-like lactoylglutathione lyase family enzyme